MAWLSGWRYRRKITISGSSGAGTNYQVLLKVGESSGATGCYFHLDGKSANFPSGKNQGGDLRFTADDGITLLSFWVEDVAGTSPNRIAYIWVKVLASLDSAESIYCYFGNPNASNGSDGANTFLFFDDFEGTVIDPNKWTILAGGWGVSDGVLSVTTLDPNEGAQIVSVSSFSDCALRAKGKITSSSTYLDTMVRNQGNVSNLYLHQVREITEAPEGLWKRVAGTWTQLASVTLGIGLDTWHIFEFRAFGSSLAGYVDDSLHASATDTTFSQCRIGFRQGTVGPGTGPAISFDWSLVRKYVSPEPAFSSASGIQVLPSSRRLFLMPI